MKGSIAVILLIIACVSAQSFVRTVENCSNCLNTAGSSVCSGDIAHFTSVCCARGETTRDCLENNDNTCTNTLRELSGVSQYLLCPSPRECTTVDYFITEFNQAIDISIPLIPNSLFCRVRIFTSVDEKYTAFFVGINATQASAGMFRVYTNETTNNQQFESIDTFTATNSTDFFMDFDRHDYFFLVLTSDAGTDGLFRMTVVLDDNSNSQDLHYLEIIFIVFGAILIVIFFIGLIVYCYMIHKESSSEKADRLRNNPSEPLKANEDVGSKA
jgi:hypothetical protein